MKKELEMVKTFHKKFSVGVGDSPQLIGVERGSFRHKLIKVEVDEYLEGAKGKDLPNVAKELCDILYGVYGTIIEHGLQDKIEEVFTEVHLSNMSKDYSEFKMVKGEGYSEANVSKIIYPELDITNINQNSKSFDFLTAEPDIYSVDDLKRTDS